MGKISFTGYIGDRPILVELSTVEGVGGDTANLYIDQRYYGKIIKREGEWVVIEQIKRLQIDDMQILIEMMENLKV